MVSVCLPSDALSQCLSLTLDVENPSRLLQQCAAAAPYFGYGVAPLGCSAPASGSRHSCRQEYLRRTGLAIIVNKRV